MVDDPIRAAVRVGQAVAAADAFGRKAETAFLPSGEQPFPWDQVGVEVHVPTLNEARVIQDTLSSLHAQRPVREDIVDVVLVDSGSKDATVDRAAPFVDRVYHADRGKLTARDQALRETTADVVVTADAGDVYPSGWLSTLVQPFREPGVVAAHGPNLSKDPIYKGVYSYVNAVRPASHMSASNSGVRRTAYHRVGGFDLEVDETDRVQVWREEEWAFPRRLRRVGAVRFVWEAGMLTSSRHLPVSLEKDPGYDAERDRGLRF